MILRNKLAKIGARVVCTARYVVFEIAEVASVRRLLRATLERNGRLKAPPVIAACQPVPGRQNGEKKVHHSRAPAVIREIPDKLYGKGT